MKTEGYLPPGCRPLSDFGQDEIEYELLRGWVIASKLSQGLPVANTDPVLMDRAAEAFRAAEPSVQARRRRRAR